MNTRPKVPKDVMDIFEYCVCASNTMTVINEQAVWLSDALHRLGADPIVPSDIVREYAASGGGVE